MGQGIDSTKASLFQYFLPPSLHPCFIPLFCPSFLSSLLFCTLQSSLGFQLYQSSYSGLPNVGLESRGCITCPGWNECHTHSPFPEASDKLLMGNSNSHLGVGLNTGENDNCRSCPWVHSKMYAFFFLKYQSVMLTWCLLGYEISKKNKRPK